MKPGPDWRAPDKLLVIAGYFRSGSGYLGSLLRSTDRLGRPAEYFNPRHAVRVADLGYDPAAHLTAFENVRDAATTPNGVCAIKFFPSHLEHLLTRCDFSAWFPATKFIWLQRADILGQAISLSIAGQTDTWQRTEQDEQSHAVFDRKRIEVAIRDIAGAHQYWAGFFGKNGIVPHIVVYETLCRDPEATVRGIARFAETGLPPTVTIASDLKRQRTDRNAEFRAAFCSQTGSIEPAGDIAMRVVARNLKNAGRWLSRRPV